MLKNTHQFTSPYPPAEAARRLSERLKGRGLLLALSAGFYGAATPGAVVIFSKGALLSNSLTTCFYGTFRAEGGGSVLEGKFGLSRSVLALSAVIGLVLLGMALMTPEVDTRWSALIVLGVVGAVLLGTWRLIYATDLPAGKQRIIAFIGEHIGEHIGGGARERNY